MTTDDRADLLRDLWRHRAAAPAGEPQKRITRCVGALVRCWERLDSGNGPGASFCHGEAVEALGGPLLDPRTPFADRDRLRQETLRQRPPELPGRVMQAPEVAA